MKKPTLITLILLLVTVALTAIFVAVGIAKNNNTQKPADTTAPITDVLLRADMAFLDNIQLQMSTAREFMFAVRTHGGSNEQSFAALNRLEKQITAQGFECKRATMKDIKRFLTRYFGWVVPDEDIDDLDGKRSVRKWSIPDELTTGKDNK